MSSIEHIFLQALAFAIFAIILTVVGFAWGYIKNKVKSWKKKNRYRNL